MSSAATSGRTPGCCPLQRRVSQHCTSLQEPNLRVPTLWSEPDPILVPFPEDKVDLAALVFRIIVKQSVHDIHTRRLWRVIQTANNFDGKGAKPCSLTSSGLRKRLAKKLVKALRVGMFLGELG